MAKKIDFFISGVWKKTSGISHVMLHKNLANGISKGIKMSEIQVVTFINVDKKSIATIHWDYNSSTWQEGVLVKVASEKGQYYLTGEREELSNEPLLKLIDMNCLHPE